MRRARLFNLPQAMLQTCARLQAAGVVNPIVLPSRQSRMTLQNMAGWVWGAGGDFTSPDGKKVLFARRASQGGHLCLLRSGALYAVGNARS